jgi:hypothetical protein
VSPRKSSTSSDRPRPLRPRYLGLEVAGEHFPSFSRDWEALLRERLDRSGHGNLTFRLVRSDGRRAIVEVGHLHVRTARTAWTVAGRTGPDLRLATRRTWGTLVGAKAWLRSMRPRPTRD